MKQGDTSWHSPTLRRNTEARCEISEYNLVTDVIKNSVSACNTNQIGIGEFISSIIIELASRIKLTKIELLTALARKKLLPASLPTSHTWQ